MGDPLVRQGVESLRVEGGGGASASHASPKSAPALNPNDDGYMLSVNIRFLLEFYKKMWFKSSFKAGI